MQHTGLTGGLPLVWNLRQTLPSDWSVKLTDQRPLIGVSGMHLVFPRGKRPSRAFMRDSVDRLATLSIAHDPSDLTRLAMVDESTPSTGVAAKTDAWLELLLEGMTFDLSGLSPGPGYALPKTSFAFDVSEDSPNAESEALLIEPGRHLAGGARTLAVMRVMTRIACELVRTFEDLKAIIWEPGDSTMGRRYFESIASEWLEGGAFPVPGFTAFRPTDDGALESVGLAHWTGQELRVEKVAGYELAEATMLATKLVDRLVEYGRFDRNDRFTAPDGRTLAIRPSETGSFVRVTAK